MSRLGHESWCTAPGVSRQYKGKHRCSSQQKQDVTNTLHYSTDNPELELYIKNTRSKVDSLPFERQRSNMQLEQRCALNSLSNRTDIIIKKADKGSLTVIQDREQYVKECFQHLFQSNVYMIYFKDPSHASESGLPIV